MIGEVKATHAYAFARSAEGDRPFRNATVVSAGQALTVEVDGQTRPAVRSVSCLVEPHSGDRVLVYDDDVVYVLAVLARLGIGDAVLSLPDRAANLRVSAQSIAVDAATSIRIGAPEVTVRATSLHLLGQTVAWLGRTLSLLGERLTASVGQSETIAERVVTKAATRVTVIDGVDTAQVGSRVSDVRGVASEMTGSTLLTGSEDVRVDAKRILLG
jgi:hypothetical protein